MPTGHVKWFNNAKGYGFIVMEGSDRDYFAHFSSINMDGFRTLKAGQPVTFEAIETPKGSHAINIEPQPPIDAADSEPTSCSIGDTLHDSSHQAPAPDSEPLHQQDQQDHHD
ncbi:MAG: CspA family cold shock protein [Cyclobacteriaceae bacterium]|jgi:CspA family cold shock protein